MKFQPHLYRPHWEKFVAAINKRADVLCALQDCVMAPTYGGEDDAQSLREAATDSEDEI